MEPKYKRPSLAIVVVVLLPFTSYGELPRKLKAVDQGVVEIFQKGIELNEQFKREKNLDRQIKLREEAETFEEDKLVPAMRSCVEQLTAGKSGLVEEFLKVILSYENSADEELSELYLQLYIKNPDLTENAIKKFRKTKQQQLIGRLLEKVKSISEKDNVEYKKARERVEKLWDDVLNDKE